MTGKEYVCNNKVKQLQWDIRNGMYESRETLCEFSIYVSIGMKYVLCINSYNKTEREEFDSIEEAKQYAQIWFDKEVTKCMNNC